MITSIERKLAFLNVSVVVAIIALIGVGTWILLARSLDREADTSLEIRIQSTRATLTNLPSMTPRQSGQNAGQGQDGNQKAKANVSDVDTEDLQEQQEESDEERDEESRDIVTSGDTLVFVFDANANLVTNRRNIVLNRIPDVDGVHAALDGDSDTRFVTIDGERLRVRTEPVYYDGEVVGAIQAARSEAEHDDELVLVRTMTLIGTGIGVLVAVPAGIYLTRRAMTPINDVLHRQRSFVSDAAHELRTPLTVLRANAEVLTRTPDLTRQALDQQLRAMMGDVDDMSHLVDELLQLSRVDTPDYAVEVGEMSLKPEIDRAITMLGPQAAQGGVALKVSGEDLQVRSNPDMVGQVVRIVLENAIKYTPTGGSVQVSTQRHGDKAVIEIRDTGIGIQPADLPYVFDRFYRADKARTRSNGTGLGLSIARGLVTLLDGTITLESTPEQGTTVRVTLPIA